MLQPLLDLAPSGSVNISPTSLFLNILPALLPLIGVFVAPALPSILDTEVTDIFPKLYPYFSPIDKTPTPTTPTLAIATATYTQEISHVAIYAVLACIVLSLFGSSLVIGKIEQPPPPPPSYPPPPPPSSSLSSPAIQLPNHIGSNEYDGSPPPPPPPPIFTTPITDPRIPHKAFLAWVVFILVAIASGYATLRRYTVRWAEVRACLMRTFQRLSVAPSPVVLPADVINVATPPTSSPVPSPRALVADNTNALVLYTPPLPPALSAQRLVADATNALVVYSLPVSPASSLRGLIGDATNASVFAPITQHHFILPSPPSSSPDVDHWVRLKVVLAVLALVLAGIEEVGSMERVQDTIMGKEDVSEVVEDITRIEGDEVETVSAADSATCLSPPMAPSPRELIGDSTNALVLYSPLLPMAPSPRVPMSYTTSSLVLAPSSCAPTGNGYSPPLPSSPSPRLLISNTTDALVLYLPPFLPRAQSPFVDSVAYSSPPPVTSPRELIGDSTNALVLYSPRVLIGYTTSPLVLSPSPFPLVPSLVAPIGDATNALVLYSPPSPRLLISEIIDALVLYSPPFVPSPPCAQNHSVIPSPPSFSPNADCWACMEVLVVRLALLLVRIEAGRTVDVRRMIGAKENVEVVVEEGSAFIEDVEGEVVDEVPSIGCTSPALGAVEEPAVVLNPHSPVPTPPTVVQTSTLSPISTPLIPAAPESSRGLNPNATPFILPTSSKPASKPLNAAAAPFIHRVATSASGLQSNAAIPGLPRKPQSASQGGAAGRSGPRSNHHGLPHKPWWVPSNGMSAPLVPNGARSAPGVYSTNSGSGLPPRPSWVPPNSGSGLPPKPSWVPPNSGSGLPPKPSWVPPKRVAMPFIPTSFFRSS